MPIVNGIGGVAVSVFGGKIYGFEAFLRLPANCATLVRVPDDSPRDLRRPLSVFPGDSGDLSRCHRLVTLIFKRETAGKR